MKTDYGKLEDIIEKMWELANKSPYISHETFLEVDRLLGHVSARRQRMDRELNRG